MFNVYIEKKNVWYKELVKRNFDNVHIEDVSDSILNLQQVAIYTNDETQKLRQKIECSENDMRNIVKKYKEGKGV
jgi:hypothetical protein